MCSMTRRFGSAIDLAPTRVILEADQIFWVRLKKVCRTRDGLWYKMSVSQPWSLLNGRNATEVTRTGLRRRVK